MSDLLLDYFIIPVTAFLIFAWAVLSLTRWTERDPLAKCKKENAQLRDRILRAQNAFFHDESDQDAALRMLNVLQEEDPHADV